MAYELIETIEVGAGGAASIEFTSIPQDGVDLAIKLSSRVAGTFGLTFKFLTLTFNSDSTGPNYVNRNLRGNGSSTTSQVTSFDGVGATVSSSATSNTFGSAGIFISNYSSSLNKSYSLDAISESNSTEALQSIWAGSYSTSSPITSIQIGSSGDSFVQYSTASLYKIY